MKYELIGRFIYGYNRVLSHVEHFCAALERRQGQEGSHQRTAETRMGEIGERAAALLTQQYGADSLIVREFLALIKSFRPYDAWLDNVKAGLELLTEPDEDEIARLLSVPQELNRIQQLMSAA